MYGPKKGFAQSHYYDQQATALAGMLANASDYNLVDSAFVKEGVGYLEAGLCVSVERSVDVFRPGVNYDRLIPPTGTSGSLTSGVIDFEALKEITNGSVKITVDSTAVDITGMDFSTGLGDVASLATFLGSKLTGKAEVSATAFGVVIRSITVGATSKVAAAAGTGGTDVSAQLKLTTAAGATVADGTAAAFGGIVVRNQQMQTTEDGIAAIEENRMANYARKGRSGARIWAQAFLSTPTKFGGEVYMVIQADTAAYPGVKVGMLTDTAMSGKAVAVEGVSFVDIFAPSVAGNNYLALVELA